MKKLYFFIFIFLFTRINLKIKENPIILVEAENPFVLSTNDDYYYVMTKGKSLKIEKESGVIINITDNQFSSSEIFFNIIEYSNNNYINNYIYIKNSSNQLNEYYHIIYNPFISYEKITVNSEPKESETSTRISIVVSIQTNNEFIIYGYSTFNTYLMFSSKSQYYISRISKNNINNNLSCKFLEGENYICAMIINSKLEIRCVMYHIVPADSSQDCLMFFPNSNTYTYDSISSLSLYDTDKNYIKILCRQIEQNIYCEILKVMINNQVQYTILSNDNFTFTTSQSFTEKNCFFSLFNSEYLFCCAITNFIKCYRININNYNIIKEFKIVIPGDNCYLTIKSNIDYINLFFMNNYNNRNSVYEYYIYTPICQNKEYYISLFNKIRLSELFSVKTNKYYIEFDNSFSTYGYFSLNDSKIVERTLISNDDYMLDFILTKTEITNSQNIIIRYIVSIEDEEAYSKECQIKFIYSTCYKSCRTCLENNSESNENQHNCIECKENYYSSPENPGNCYLIEEKKKNWYFDSSNSKFGICDEKCMSCSGPNNCIYCKNNFF